MNPAPQPSITVVGAGLAGLAAAHLLASRGVATTLVGPASDPADTRTTALLSGSVDALVAAGVWYSVEAASAPLRTMRIVDASSRLLRSAPISFEAEEIGLEAFGWNIPNCVLSRSLEDAAAANPLIHRRFDRVAAVECRPQAVTLTMANGDRISSLLAIAADGRSSQTREAAGIGSRTWRYPQVALTLNVRHRRPHRDVSTEFHTESGPFTLVPLPGDRSSLVYVMEPAEAERVAALTDDGLSLELERRCGSYLGCMEVDGPRSFWPLGGLAAREVAANRVALVGEASHVVPPIGAQGFNLTMRDILALCAVLPGSADPGSHAVLADYADRRRVDVAARTTAVDLLNRSLLSDFLPLQFARGLGLYALSRIRPLRQAAMRQGLAPALAP